MHSRRILFLTALFAMVVAACDQGGPTGGDLTSRIGRLSSDTASPPDTSPPDTVPPDTIPTDTVPPDTGTYRGPVRLTVNVVAFQFDSLPPDSVPGDTISRDTVSLVPVANAIVRIRRVHPPGPPITGRTDSAGNFSSRLLRAGAFRITVVPPTGSGLSGSTQIVQLNAPVMTVQTVLFP